jgi:HK97 family phage portal protein
MRFGPFKIDIGKNYSDLVAIMNREKGASIENLKGNTQSQLKEYKSWVFACTSLIEKRVSSVPFYFYRTDRNEEVTSSNKSYKTFTKPFFKPNDIMTFRFIKSFCQLQLDLCGMTCIYPARNRLGQIWEIWPLNMNDFVSVDVINDFLNPKVIYTFNFENKQIQFDSKELITIKYANPLDPHSFMSPIQAQAYAVDIDRYVEHYERDFFKNSARIDMALYTDAEIGQEKADEIKERWKSKYSGNFHDVAVLSSGLKPVPLKFTNKDFEFLNLAGWSKSKIFGAYGVPISKAGGDTESNRAGSVTADIAFNRECIASRLSLWDEVLTRSILHDFDERIEVRHHDPIPRDRDLDVKEARVYLAAQPAMAINEFRRETLDLPKQEGGDEILVSIKGSLVPLSRAKEFVDLLLNESNNSGGNGGGDNETDPTRHDNDKPNVNPDGTDDRDDNPTDGRSIQENESLEMKLSKFFEYEDAFRETWNKNIVDTLIKTNNQDVKEKIAKFISELSFKTIGILFQHLGIDSIVFEKSNWISPISEKLAYEYQVTLNKHYSDDLDWKDHVEKQFDSQPRMSKITNTLLRGTINYTKYLIMSDKKINMDWKVNRNECGHRGRPKLGEGEIKLLFPNQTPNFSCDCSIEPKREL